MKNIQFIKSGNCFVNFLGLFTVQNVFLSEKKLNSLDKYILTTDILYITNLFNQFIYCKNAYLFTLIIISNFTHL